MSEAAPGNTRITVNLGSVLAILENHLSEITDATGIATRNGIITDAVADYIRKTVTTLTEGEKLALRLLSPRVTSNWES